MSKKFKTNKLYMVVKVTFKNLTLKPINFILISTLNVVTILKVT